MIKGYVRQIEKIRITYKHDPDHRLVHDWLFERGFRIIRSGPAPRQGENFDTNKQLIIAEREVGTRSSRTIKKEVAP